MAVPGREGHEPAGADTRAADDAEAVISPVGRPHREAMLDRIYRRWQGSRVETAGGYFGTVQAITTEGVLYVERDDGWFLPYDEHELRVLP